VDSLIDAETVERPRVWAIVVAAFVGFLAGQILGSLFQLVGVSLAHYPGGLSALANAGSPPWWANVLGLLGLWTGFAGAIYYAYAYGNLRSLPHQWQVRPSDLIYVAVGVRLSVHRRRRLHSLSRAPPESPGEPSVRLGRWREFRPPRSSMTTFLHP